MNDQAPNDKLLFTKCTNLNTDQCPYNKKPEIVLSSFKDPKNFPISDQQVWELNNTCSGCEGFQMKTMET